jgi:hypothetical protein
MEQAVEQRNFHDAKAYLDELFPIMKEEIKKGKKTLATLEKEANPDAVDYAKRLERKSELYESMKSVVDISAAAFRVKIDDIMTMVKEFDDLVEA